MLYSNCTPFVPLISLLNKSFFLQITIYTDSEKIFLDLGSPETILWFTE